MKNNFNFFIRAVFIAALSALAFNISAQNGYSFQKSNTSYNAITGTVVTGPSPWSPFTAHPIPIGFSFIYFGNSYSTLYCEGSGFCIFDITGYKYTVHPFTVEMRDAGTSTSSSQSPISYEVTGTAPNRICKIQWQNCELKKDLGSYANFQLWLYEGSNIIESRIGNCTINNPALAFQANGNPGPLVAIYKTTGNPHYGYCVQGSSPTETLLSLSSGTIANIFQNSMSSTPPSGSVYRFIPVTSSGIKLISEIEFNMPIYPNPSTHSVLFVSESESNWSITDLNCKLLLIGRASKGQNEIDISGLPNGIYILRLNQQTIKIIKE